MNLSNIVNELAKRVKNILGLRNTLESIGIRSAASNAMTAAITKWGEMYHNSKGLALPSSIASEMARLVTLEMKSRVTGSERAEYLDKEYNKVISKIRTVCEYAAAKGGVMLKPYVTGGNITIDTVQAENFIPTKFDVSGNITAVAFLSRIYKGKKIYTRIEHHDYNEETYQITNMAFESNETATIGKKIPLSDVSEWAEIEPSVTIEKAYAPFFSYFKMPMANIIDQESPLGVSVYAKAADLISDADKQYERFLWEFESGERALYIAEEAFRRDKSGQRIFPDKRLYRLLNSEDDSLYKEWTPTIRETEIISGLNDILRKIEFVTGLAYGTLSDVQNVDKTAEEIKASKQRSYATVTEIQTGLKTALSELVKSMDVLCDLYELAPSGEYSVSFDFDDSIIADRKTEFEEKMRLFTAGIMQPWEFRAWYFGEDEKTAKQNVALPDMELEE